MGLSVCCPLNSQFSFASFQPVQPVNKMTCFCLDQPTKQTNSYNSIYGLQTYNLILLLVRLTILLASGPVDSYTHNYI